MLQEQGMIPVVAPERMLEWGPKLDEAVRDRGSRTLLFLTWARAAAPPPALHVDDRSHATPVDTYLAAGTFYGVIHGKSPVGRLAGLDDPTRMLQEAAWEAVEARAAEPAARRARHNHPSG